MRAIMKLTVKNIPTEVFGDMIERIRNDIAERVDGRYESAEVYTEDGCSADGREFGYEVNTEFYLAHDPGTDYAPPSEWVEVLSYEGCITEYDPDSDEAIAEYEFNDKTLLLHI